MTGPIEQPTRASDQRSMTRRDLLALAVALGGLQQGRALARPRAKPAAIQSALPIRVSTLNHVSFGCADLQRTVAWYERVLGVPRHAFQDYGGGQTVLRLASDPPAYMALSQRSPESFAAPPTRRPHFCWGIEDFNVHRIFEALAEMPALARSVLGEGTTPTSFALS